MKMKIRRIDRRVLGALAGSLLVAACAEPAKPAAAQTEAAASPVAAGRSSIVRHVHFEVLVVARHFNVYRVCIAGVSDRVGDGFLHRTEERRLCLRSHRGCLRRRRELDLGANEVPPQGGAAPLAAVRPHRELAAQEPGVAADVDALLA